MITKLVIVVIFASIGITEFDNYLKSFILRDGLVDTSDGREDTITETTEVYKEAIASNKRIKIIRVIQAITLLAAVVYQSGLLSNR